MNFSETFFRFLAIIIGLAIFGFYVYIVNDFTSENIFKLPYLILTIYFAICVVLFPFIAFKKNTMVKKLKAVPSTFMQIGVFIIAPYLFIKHFFNTQHNSRL
ncbi:hypothetical protein JCM19029_25820 [Salinicoccus sesuvii]